MSETTPRCQRALLRPPSTAASSSSHPPGPSSSQRRTASVTMCGSPRCPSSLTRLNRTDISLFPRRCHSSMNRSRRSSPPPPVALHVRGMSNSLSFPLRLRFPPASPPSHRSETPSKFTKARAERAFNVVGRRRLSPKRNPRYQRHLLPSHVSLGKVTDILESVPTLPPLQQSAQVVAAPSTSSMTNPSLPARLSSASVESATRATPPAGKHPVLFQPQQVQGQCAWQPSSTLRLSAGAATTGMKRASSLSSHEIDKLPCSGLTTVPTSAISPA